MIHQHCYSQEIISYQCGAPHGVSSPSWGVQYAGDYLLSDTGLNVLPKRLNTDGF
jgi:hypothetical protein